ncbi:MAG: acetoacetate--CoA ligase, partial [Nevskiaceae bacterium]
YVHAHNGRVFVIAFGGEAAERPDFDQLIYDVALLHSLGVKLVLIHGARPQVDSELAVRDITSDYVDNLRVTDGPTLDCVMAAVGRLRMEIEAKLSTSLASTSMGGARLKVASGNWITGKPVGVRQGVDMQYTGDVRRVDIASIKANLEADRICLISPIGYSPTGEIFNLRAEDVATAVAAALAADGVVPGDRVAGFLPNTLEPVIAMLATASLGAIWSSCSPDFGLPGVLDRFGQIEPKVLFACDGYSYAGKPVDTRERVARIVQALPELKRLVIVPFLNGEKGSDEFFSPKNAKNSSDPFLFDDYAAPGELAFAPLPFDHPLYILYSSGTTGVPKCIVHGAGGTLLQHLKELVLHTDVKPGDRLFFYTTCGWMMWNWLVSGLAAGATVVLYDGAPTHPGPEALWQLAERERLTQMGVSPRYLAALEKSGYRPSEHHALPELRTLLSTGSPLAPEQFEFAYRDIKADVQLASISGGTDIISCFALGNPLLPVYRGELQCRGLGMAVDVFDEDGTPARGKPGELVCTRPFPSMPLGFWNDPDGVRYRAAYFERFPGVWHHGDYARLMPSGGLVISGRSDATLNPGGVRIGTAEIYRVVDA